MNPLVLKEIIYDLTKAVEILEHREPKDLELLKDLSDHAIEDVAVHKDLDLISVTVLIYSLYKIVNTLNDVDYKNITVNLKEAQKSLQERNLGRYNKTIKTIFEAIHRTDAKVKMHLQDVLDAARIKKGTALLERGLSIGQAAGLMGLSNWDLQQYAGKTTALEMHDELYPAQKRLQLAFKLFKVS